MSETLFEQVLCLSVVGGFILVLVIRAIKGHDDL